MIDSMYRLAKYRYECGNYVESASYLYFCQLVMSPTDRVTTFFLNLLLLLTVVSLINKKIFMHDIYFVKYMSHLCILIKTLLFLTQ